MDTKSKHSSSISSIDPDQIFYMRSRGLGESDARTLIINGFTSYVDDYTDNEYFKDIIREKINVRLK